MEDDRLVAGAFQGRANAHHRRRRVPEHRDAHAAPAQVAKRRSRLPGHAHDRRGRVVEDGPGDRVEAEDVDDRVHDEDVALADEGTERAATRGARRDDQLRDADGKGVHPGRAQEGSLRPAQAEHAVQVILEPEAEADCADPLCHQLDRGAAAARRLDLLELVARLAGHVLPRHVGARAGLSQDPRVDHDRPGAEPRQPLAHVRDLLALGVERPDQRDPRLVRHRFSITPARATPGCAPRPAPSGTPRARPRGARRRARTSARPSRPSP